MSTHLDQRDRGADLALKLAAEYEAALKIKDYREYRAETDRIEARARSAGVWSMFFAAAFGGCQ